jgi:hypothetical protein
LLGQRPEQDTVADPYDGNPAVSADWIADELYARFYQLPSGVSLTLREGCHIQTGDRSFMPIGARAGEFAHYEAIPTERGLTLHYYFDAPDPDVAGGLMPAHHALQGAHGTAGVIYRGEIYDIRRPSWTWIHEAPVYGLPFGARHFSVYVTLPDEFPVLPDGYCQFLRHADNLHTT